MTVHFIPASAYPVESFTPPSPQPGKKYYVVTDGKFYKSFQELKNSFWFEWTFKLTANGSWIYYAPETTEGSTGKRTWTRIQNYAELQNLAQSDKEI